MIGSLSAPLNTAHIQQADLPTQQFDFRNVTGTRYIEGSFVFDTANFPSTGPIPDAPTLSFNTSEIEAQYAYNRASSFRTCSIGLSEYCLTHYAGFTEADRLPLAVRCPQLQAESESRYLTILPNDSGAGLFSSSSVNIIGRLPPVLQFTIGILSRDIANVGLANPNITNASVNPPISSQQLRTVNFRFFMIFRWEPYRIPVFGPAASNASAQQSLKTMAKVLSMSGMGGIASAMQAATTDPLAIGAMLSAASSDGGQGNSGVPETDGGDGGAGSIAQDSIHAAVGAIGQEGESSQLPVGPGSAPGGTGAADFGYLGKPGQVGSGGGGGGGGGGRGGGGGGRRGRSGRYNEQPNGGVPFVSGQATAANAANQSAAPAPAVAPNAGLPPAVPGTVEPVRVSAAAPRAEGGAGSEVGHAAGADAVSQLQGLGGAPPIVQEALAEGVHLRVGEYLNGLPPPGGSWDAESDGGPAPSEVGEGDIVSDIQRRHRDEHESVSVAAADQLQAEAAVADPALRSLQQGLDKELPVARSIAPDIAYPVVPDPAEAPQGGPTLQIEPLPARSGRKAHTRAASANAPELEPEEDINTAVGGGGSGGDPFEHVDLAGPITPRFHSKGYIPDTYNPRTSMLPTQTPGTHPPRPPAAERQYRDAAGSVVMGAPSVVSSSSSSGRGPRPPLDTMHGALSSSVAQLVRSSQGGGPGGALGKLPLGGGLVFPGGWPAGVKRGRK